MSLLRSWGYTGNNFENFLKEQGMDHHLTTHDTPQHNRIAEALNRCLLKHICAMLQESWLPKSLWGEVAHHAIWLKNCTSTWILRDTTPFEWLYKAKPHLSSIPEWGQTVWVHHNTGNKTQYALRRSTLGRI